MMPPLGDMIGNAGQPTQAGRPVPEPTEDEERVVHHEGWVPALPSPCVRKLNSPRELNCGAGSQMMCPGMQRDGSCLCDLIVAANTQGVEWTFDIDYDGYWVPTFELE